MREFANFQSVSHSFSPYSRAGNSSEFQQYFTWINKGSFEFTGIPEFFDVLKAGKQSALHA